MSPEIGFLLLRLEAEFNKALDMIHADALAKFRTWARSVGQLTRVDRAMK